MLIIKGFSNPIVFKGFKGCYSFKASGIFALRWTPLVFHLINLLFSGKATPELLPQNILVHVECYGYS